jgi:signal transduction histidine kinase
VLSANRNEALCVIRESRFAPGAAHDLNNCFTAVECASGALLTDPGLSGDSRAAVREILDAIRRAERITGRMVSGARLHAVDTVPLDLERELRSVLALLRRSMPSQVALRSEVDLDTPFVRMSAEQLQRVVMNLVSNARQAIDDGERYGTVWVRAWGESSKRDGVLDRAVIEVSDDGRGMTPEVLGRVFEPWFTTRADGNGLGMGSVRDLVRSAGGTIRITSREGEGTTVHVSLPAFMPRTSNPFACGNVTACESE